MIVHTIRDMRRRRRKRRWPSQYPYDPRLWSSRHGLDVAWSAFINRMYFPALGSRSTAGGRGHRASQSKEAKQKRRELAWKAYYARTMDGRSIRDIAEELGVSKSNVGRWLEGVPRVKQDQLRSFGDQLRSFLDH
jgi:DNA-directed RNA polymerase specialized sigma24 family protein